MLALTRAIEAWSDGITRRDPMAFVHRGADLRWAVERDLFFELVHDAGLRKTFVATGGSEFDITVPPLPLTKRLRYELGNLSRIGKVSLVTARLLEKPQFLFLTIHPKFVTFLKPIADALGSRAAFLTVLDPVTDAYLEKLGLPTVSVRPGFTFSPVPGGVLGHFAPLCRHFDLVSAMIAKLQPRVIAVPEGNAPVYELAHRAGLPQGVATVCIQHGAPAYTNPGFRNWTFEDMLVWGSQFIEPFAKYNPRQRFTAIGTPAKLATPRPRAGTQPVRSVGFFLQKAGETIPFQEWVDLLDFIAWTARTFPALDIVVREHPTQPRLDASELERLGGLPNIRFMASPQYSIGDTLSACDIVVGAASTTLLEAIEAGAIPFIFGTAYPPDFPSISVLGAAAEGATLAEAKNAMTRLIQDEVMRAQLHQQGERIRPELFAASGQAGAVLLAEALAQIARCASVDA